MAPLFNSWGNRAFGTFKTQTPPWAPSGVYDSIATVSVGSGGSSTVTFSSIPSTYTHLQIRGIYRAPSNATYMAVGTGSANYGLKGHYLGGGNGGSTYGGVLSPTGTKGLALDVYVGALVANQFGAIIIDILDYANTSKYKTARAIGGYEDASSTVILISHLFDTTSAITSITLTADGNYAQYSSFALYGIKGA